MRRTVAERSLAFLVSQWHEPRTVFESTRVRVVHRPVALVSANIDGKLGPAVRVRIEEDWYVDGELTDKDNVMVALR